MKVKMNKNGQSVVIPETNWIAKDYLRKNGYENYMTVPRMILGETSLSFLGLGIRAPAISWGILLQEAQNIRSVALFPWLLLPGVAVIITVLAFNFIGDGLRDAADPYST